MALVRARGLVQWCKECVLPMEVCCVPSGGYAFSVYYLFKFMLEGSDGFSPILHMKILSLRMCEFIKLVTVELN